MTTKNQIWLTEHLTVEDAERMESEAVRKYEGTFYPTNSLMLTVIAHVYESGRRDERAEKRTDATTAAT